MTMTFLVTEECSRLGLRAGAVLFRNVRVGPASSALRAVIIQEAQAVRTRYASPHAVRLDPAVVCFQEILRKAGANPRKDQPSLERLLSLALKRADLPTINNLVDAYNLVSIRSSCSLGAHDLDQITLPVSLRLLTGRESFTALGRDAAEVVTPGDYGYVDAADRVLCRLDVRQAEFSKVTSATVNALLIVEGTATHPPAALQQAVAEVIELVTRHCGGTAEVVALPPE
jgi:DNA/RNA-binding domain of Phe-tRNA-synthetase-like protein